MELEQALNPGPAQAGKLIAGIEAPTQRIKALAQIATALHAAGQPDLSQALLEQAGTETEELEESDEMLAAKTALALAQMNMGQPEAAEQIETLVIQISALETSEAQLTAYEKLTRELALGPPGNCGRAVGTHSGFRAQATLSGRSRITAGQWRGGSQRARACTL